MFPLFIFIIFITLLLYVYYVKYCYVALADELQCPNKI